MLHVTDEIVIHAQDFSKSLHLSTKSQLLWNSQAGHQTNEWKDITLMLFGVNDVAAYCVSKPFSAQNCSPCQGPQSESTGVVVLEWPLVHNSLLFKGLGALKYSVNVIHTLLYSFELTCISTVLVSFVNVYLFSSWYNSFPGGACFSFFY